MQDKLVVGNLPLKTTRAMLLDTFAAFGTVTKTSLMVDYSAAEPRVIAFVTLGSASEAKQAMLAMNARSTDRHDLKVTVATLPKACPSDGQMDIHHFQE